MRSSGEPDRDYAIGDEGFDRLLAQFRDLAQDFLQAALESRHHGFSNVKETIEEIHKGVSKAYPCGAGLGLMGVATDGDVNLCHRFAGSDAHKLGTVTGGIDRGAQRGFLERHLGIVGCRYVRDRFGDDPPDGRQGLSAGVRNQCDHQRLAAGHHHSTES